MKTLILQTSKDEQFTILLSLAKELGIRTRTIDNDNPDEPFLTSSFAETVFSKDWNSIEDEHWTQFLTKK